MFSVASRDYDECRMMWYRRGPPSDRALWLPPTCESLYHWWQCLLHRQTSKTSQIVPIGICFLWYCVIKRCSKSRVRQYFMPFKILTERYTVSTFQVMLPIWFKTYQWQNHAFQRKGANLLLPPATKLGQGNIFSQASVILFGGGGGGCLSACWDTIPSGLGGHPPRTRYPRD